MAAIIALIVILGRLSQQVTVDIGPRVIVHQCKLISCSVFVSESDLFEEVAVPKAVRMFALIEPPGDWSRTRIPLMKDSSLDSAGGGRTDTQTVMILRNHLTNSLVA